jgi:hypothetical protein
VSFGVRDEMIDILGGHKRAARVPRRIVAVVRPSRAGFRVEPKSRPTRRKTRDREAYQAVV